MPDAAVLHIPDVVAVPRPLIACLECDLLQREMPLPPRGIARCRRCGAELYRNHRDGLERSRALTAGALVLYALANAFPVLGLEVGGNRVETTLMGSVLALYEQQMRLVAGVVFVTAILMPLAQLAALAYLLLPPSPHMAVRAPEAYRIFILARAWSMIEVFMLGIMVALVKLAHIAAITPGVGLWSFGGLMVLLAAATAAFDPRALWSRLGALQ
jgi:paraquat-inducible protein A